MTRTQGFSAVQTARAASSGLPAPSAWPTSAVVATEKPSPGSVPMLSTVLIDVFAA